MASLGNGTYHQSLISWWDKSLEQGRLEVFGAVVTATIVSAAVVNFTAQATLFAALVTAANDMVLGTLRSARWVNESITNAFPIQDDIDQGATRELKLLVQYIDNTSQKRYTATLPTLDLTKVTYLPQAGDFVAITTEQGASAEVVAFVAAFEGYAVASATGNAVTVVGLKVVGRNN